MGADCLPCLTQATRELLAPHRVSRIAVLGSDQAAQEDVHLLVEFGRNARAITASDWLRWQRELRERCGCRAELVSVNQLERHVAADDVALIVLFDSSIDA